MPTLKADLHTHLKVSKRTPLQPGEARRFVRQARSRGLHALAVTEHFHATGFWAMYDSLLREFRYRRGRFEIDGLLCFVGAELTLAERADVVLLTTLSDLKALDDAFPTALSAGYHPSADELNRVMRRTGSLAVRIAAHPFRADKGLANLEPADAAELFHAAEINARFCEREAIRGAHAFAHDIAGPVVAGSDAHVFSQVGAAWTEIEFPGAPCHATQWHAERRDVARSETMSVRDALANPTEAGSPSPLGGRGWSAPRRPGEGARPSPAPELSAIPDISFDDLRDALLTAEASTPARRSRITPVLHPEAGSICRNGAALKASLKATLPKIDRAAASDAAIAV